MQTAETAEGRKSENRKMKEDAKGRWKALVFELTLQALYGAVFTAGGVVAANLMKRQRPVAEVVPIKKVL